MHQFYSSQQRNKALMYGLLVLVGLFMSPWKASAQFPLPYYVGNVSVTAQQFGISVDCGNDQGGLPGLGNPDPRIYVTVGYDGANYGNQANFAIDEAPCPWNIPDQLLQEFNNICGSTINVNMTAWEEDCGGNNNFDGCCNPIFGLCTGEDDGYYVNNSSVQFQNYPPYTNNIFTLGGGNFNIEVSINWTPASTVSTSGNVTICSGETATISASHIGPVPASNFFNWYADQARTQFLASGPTFTTPALTQTTTYYVTEVFGGLSCESVEVAVTVTVLPVNPAPTANNASVCFGQAATLTASGVGTIQWFSDPNGNNLLFTGSPFTTPLLNQNTTYYVGDFSGSCLSQLVPVLVTVNALPTPPVVADYVFCENEIVSLTANGDPTLQWYDVPVGGTVLGTGPTFSPGLLAAGNYNYYVASYNGFCESNRDVSIVLVNSIPAAPNGTGATVCQGDQATLVATGVGVNFNWYDVATGGQPLLTGSTYLTPPMAGPDTFWVAIIGGNGCESNRTPVPVDVYLSPVPTTLGTSICPGSTATLTANAAGASSFNWYANQDGTGLLYTGVTYTTPILNATTTYYVAAIYPTGCVSDVAALTVAVLPALPAPNAADQTVCAGDSVILTAIGGGGTYNWYSAPNDPNPVATGPVFNAGLLAVGSYTYYISELNGTCESQRQAVVVTVLPQPSQPNAAGVAVCAGQPAIISAAANGLVQWYADAALTNLLGVGNVFYTTPLNATTTFYAVNTLGACSSVAFPVTVTVNPAPTNTVATGATLCPGQTATLTVSGDPTSTFMWYFDPTGVAIAGTGASYTSPALFASTYYYVRETTATGCQSILIPVLAQVRQLPSTPAGSNIGLCANATGTLTAAGSGTGLLNWFDANGTLLQTNPMPPAVATLSVGPFATPGTYVYYISENDGFCASDRSAMVVTVSAQPNAPNIAGATICAGETASLAAAGPGDIAWYDAPLNGNLLAAGNTYETPVLNATTTYYVTQDVNGCESQRVAVTATVNPLPTFGAGVVTSNSPLCEGEDLQLNAPFVANVTYSWDGPNGWFSNQQSPLIPAVTEADNQGFYSLNLVDAVTGCESETEVLLVQVNALPSSGIAANTGPACAGTDVQLLATSVFGASYSWTGPNGFASTDQNPVIAGATVADQGTYSVVVSIGSCSAAPASTLLLVRDAPVVTVSGDTTIEQGSHATLNASGAVGYAWSPADFLSNGNVPNPVFMGSVAGVFALTVTGTNGFGCSDTAQVTVTVTETQNIRPVDLFTPNGDGVNDTWTILYLENLVDYTLAVYDRSGQELLKTNSYNNDWDGTYSGKPVPDGTYYYLISVDGRDYKGPVTIKR